MLNLDNYELGIYKSAMLYGEDGEPQDSQLKLDGERLRPIYRYQVQLIPGTPAQGWIGVAVHYLPDWDQDAELIGTRVEYREYEDTGDGPGAPIEESAYPVDEYVYTSHTRTVETMTLTVVDAFGQTWTATKLQPFGVKDRDIVKRKREDIPLDV